MSVQELRDILQSQIDDLSQRMRHVSEKRKADKHALSSGASLAESSKDEDVQLAFTALATRMADSVVSRLCTAHPELAATDARGASASAVGDASSVAQDHAELQQTLDARRAEERRLQRELQEALQAREKEEERQLRKSIELRINGGASSGEDGGHSSGEVEGDQAGELQDGLKQLQQRVQKMQEAFEGLSKKRGNIEKIEAEQRMMETSSMAWLFGGELDCITGIADDAEHSKLFENLEQLRKECHDASAFAAEELDKEVREAKVARRST